MEYAFNALGVLLLAYLVHRAVNAIGSSRSAASAKDEESRQDPHRAGRRSERTRMEGASP
jgi:hypothetical protein